jgi:hypothetical protein
MQQLPDAQDICAVLADRHAQHKREAESIEPCPACGGEVMTIEPVIEPGERQEMYGGAMFVTLPGRVVAYKLNPCGHQVKYVEWHIHHGTKFPTKPSFGEPR